MPDIAKRNGQKRREQIRELRYERRLTPRQIATLLNISTQAVYQHLARIKDEEKAAV